MKKVSQKKFTKWARKFYTEKDIKKVINFMREHNGFISYRDFAIFLALFKDSNLNNTLAYLTEATQYCGKFQLSINKGVRYSECEK